MPTTMTREDVDAIVCRLAAAQVGAAPAAVTATTVKLCHATWRILTDQRDYLPQRPNTKP